MTVKRAVEIATGWVENCDLPGLIGAYIAGSCADMEAEDTLPIGSDADIMLVYDGVKSREKIGKFVHDNVLLEATWLKWGDICDPEATLSNYHVANGLKKNTIIYDATGELTRLQECIEARFFAKDSIRARCDSVILRIESAFERFDLSRPYPDLLMGWVFPASLPTHAILVAACKNPTIRKRYIAARAYLSAPEYEKMLSQMHCENWTRDIALKQVKRLEPLFDAAAALNDHDYPYSSDISHEARAIAIDGSYDMINAGNYREAAFFVAATYARCHKILPSDAFLPDYYDLLNDLRIFSPDDYEIAAYSTLKYLPHLRELSYGIIDATCR